MCYFVNVLLPLVDELRTLDWGSIEKSLEKLELVRV